MSDIDIDTDGRPATRRIGVCRECDELTLSVAEPGQLVCRLTFKEGVPPRATLPEDIRGEQLSRYEQRRVPRRCKRLDVYETVNKLRVL